MRKPCLIILAIAMLLAWCLCCCCFCQAAPPVSYQLADGNFLIQDELFVSIVDPHKRVPILCCYTVTAESQSGSGEERNFHVVEPFASLSPAEYKHSGYDIGHLAPLGSFDGCEEVADVNCMENCAPQRPALNRGPWLKLEERERELAVSTGYPVHVSCGCYFRNREEPLKEAEKDWPHKVPSHFWKTIDYCVHRVEVGGKIKEQDRRRETYVFPQDCDRSAPVESFRVPGLIKGHKS